MQFSSHLSCTLHLILGVTFLYNSVAFWFCQTLFLPHLNLEIWSFVMRGTGYRLDLEGSLLRLRRPSF